MIFEISILMASFINMATTIDESAAYAGYDAACAVACAPHQVDALSPGHKETASN